MEISALNAVIDFLYSIASNLFDFIASNSLVKWFLFVPIALGLVVGVGYFVFDLTHVLDDYNAKNTMLYKGMKKYDKQQAQQRKIENKSKSIKYGEFKKTDFEKKLYKVDQKYKGQKADFSKIPYSRTIKYNLSNSKPKKNQKFDIVVED